MEWVLLEQRGQAQDSFLLTPSWAPSGEVSCTTPELDGTPLMSGLAGAEVRNWACSQREGALLWSDLRLLPPSHLPSPLRRPRTRD